MCLFMGAVRWCLYKETTALLACQVQGCTADTQLQPCIGMLAQVLVIVHMS